MSDPLPRADKRSRLELACSLSCVDGAPSDDPVNGPTTAAMASDERPPSGDAEAPFSQPVSITPFQAAASSSDRHEVQLPSAVHQRS